MSTQEVAAYRTPQDPAYDPTEGASGSALPSAGKMDNPLFEEQQQQDISGTAYDQGNTSNGPFASPRQQEFYSTMYSSQPALQRQSSSLSDTSLSSLDVSEQQSAQCGSSSHGHQAPSSSSLVNAAFSDQPLLGSIGNTEQHTPSVAAASLDSFYRGPFFPRKSSLPVPSQQAESMSASDPVHGVTSGTAELLTAPVSTHETPAFSSVPLLGGSLSSGPVHQGPPLYDSPAQQVESTEPFYTQPPFDVHDQQHQYAELPEASIPPVVQAASPVTSPTFADGPMFNGSPLLSPSDDDEVVSTADPVQQEQAFVSHTPFFHDNPMFSAQEEQQQVTMSAAPAQHEPSVTWVEPSLLNDVSPAFQARQSFEQHQEAVLPSATLQQQPAVIGSPSFSSSPIFGSDIQQPRGAVYAPSPPLTPMQHQQPVALAEPAVSERNVGLTSQPILGGAEQPEVYTSAPIASAMQEDISLVAEPVMKEQDSAFSSTPILGAALQQQAPVYTSPQVVTPMLQETSLTVAEPQLADDGPAFSSQPIFSSAVEQQQEVYTPAQVATPMQQEPALTSQHPTFSSKPLLGGQQQQQGYTPAQSPALVQPLEDPLYDPTQRGSAVVVHETPIVIDSPTFQSRPIFGGSGEQQQQVQVQPASADNPWAYREASLPEREPSFALAPPRQGISFHDNSLFESSEQPQILSDSIITGTPVWSAPTQTPAQAASFRQPAWAQQTPAVPLNQGITFHAESPFDAPEQRSSPYTHVPVPVPVPSFSFQPTLGLPAPTDTAQLPTAQQDTAQLDTAHRLNFSPTSTFTPPAPTRAAANSPSVALFDAPPLGQFSSAPVSFSSGVSQPTVIDQPLSDPLYDPTRRAPAARPAAARPAALLEPLEDPLYDPVQRRPAVAQSTITQVRPYVPEPLDDPLYDPTVQKPRLAARPAPAASHAPHGRHFVAALNKRILEPLDDPLYDPAAVETAPGQKDITHRGEQIGTPHFATHPQQTSAFASAASEAPLQPSYQGLSSRLGASRRPVRTVNLANIGLPAPMPQRGETYAAPAPAKPEELGAADVLPQDEHYAKATAYDELGANARSALSGAGWKSSWANEMEASAQRGSAQGTATQPARFMTSMLSCIYCISVCITRRLVSVSDCYQSAGLHANINACVSNNAFVLL